MTINFKLVSEFLNVHTRSFELANTTILNPTVTNPLVDGEFLEIDTAYKMARGSGDATVPSYCYFQQQGAYDVQALGKGPFLFLNQYEADTKVFDGTSVVEGSPLTVGDVTYGGQTRRGLKLWTSGKYLVGHATRLAANNGGFLRFTKGS